MSAVPSITLFRQAVTAPATHGEAPHHDLAASIVAEIAERLEELDDLKRESAADLVIQLASIAGTSRRAFRVTVQLLHGNMDDVLSSYQQQADRRGVTKQDIHYEFAHEIWRLQRSFPELHRCILAMRAQAQNHEDPMSKAEVANASGGGGE
jgi:hypothetical protein